MDNQSTKPFDKPWFYANWVAFCLVLLANIAHGYRHPGVPIPRHSFAFPGLVLASIAAHAVYSGYFAVRNAVYRREEDPGSFWLAIVAFGVLSLIFFRMAVT